MFPVRLLCALLVLLPPTQSLQDQSPPAFPAIKLELPPGTLSENIEINYMLTGTFGGAGSFIKSKPNQTSYTIPASYDRKPATHVAVVAYLPGCEIATLERDLFNENSISLPLICRPLANIPIRGKFDPQWINDRKPTKIQVTYFAYWGYKFFHILDGPLLTIPLVSAIPGRDGSFSISLPAFSQQEKMDDGAFEFLLRDAETNNIIGRLNPTENMDASGELKVLPSYPPTVDFKFEPWEIASTQGAPQ